MGARFLLENFMIFPYRVKDEFFLLLTTKILYSSWLDLTMIAIPRTIIKRPSAPMRTSISTEINKALNVNKITLSVAHNVR